MRDKMNAAGLNLRSRPVIAVLIIKRPYRSRRLKTEMRIDYVEDNAFLSAFPTHH